MPKIPPKSATGPARLPVSTPNANGANKVQTPQAPPAAVTSQGAQATDGIVDTLRAAGAALAEMTGPVARIAASFFTEPPEPPAQVVDVYNVTRLERVSGFARHRYDGLTRAAREGVYLLLVRGVAAVNIERVLKNPAISGAGGADHVFATVAALYAHGATGFERAFRASDIDERFLSPKGHRTHSMQAEMEAALMLAANTGAKVEMGKELGLDGGRMVETTAVATLPDGRRVLLEVKSSSGIFNPNTAAWMNIMEQAESRAKLVKHHGLAGIDYVFRSAGVNREFLEALAARLKRAGVPFIIRVEGGRAREAIDGGLRYDRSDGVVASDRGKRALPVVIPGSKTPGNEIVLEGFQRSDQVDVKSRFTGRALDATQLAERLWRGELSKVRDLIRVVEMERGEKVYFVDWAGLQRSGLDARYPDFEELKVIVGKEAALKTLLMHLGADENGFKGKRDFCLVGQQGVDESVFGLRIIGAEDARKLGHQYFILQLKLDDNGGLVFKPPAGDDRTRGTDSIDLALGFLKGRDIELADPVEKSIVASWIGARVVAETGYVSLTMAQVAAFLGRGDAAVRLKILHKVLFGTPPPDRFAIVGGQESNGSVGGLRIISAEDARKLNRYHFILQLKAADSGRLVFEPSAGDDQTRGKGSLDLVLGFLKARGIELADPVEKSIVASWTGARVMAESGYVSLTKAQVVAFLGKGGAVARLGILHEVLFDIPLPARFAMVGGHRLNGSVNGLRIVDETNGHVQDRRYFAAILAREGDGNSTVSLPKKPTAATRRLFEMIQTARAGVGAVSGDRPAPIEDRTVAMGPSVDANGELFRLPGYGDLLPARKTEIADFVHTILLDEGFKREYVRDGRITPAGLEQLTARVRKSASVAAPAEPVRPERPQRSAGADEDGREEDAERDKGAEGKSPVK
ncbi:MAG: hypothetical protein V2A66_03515 [Pseudomonadota bacterium]